LYDENIAAVAELARAKSAKTTQDPLGYLVASMLAGMYVGIGIALIFSIGAPVATSGSPYLKTLMGASFGIALTLVIFAGSELFTGNNLVMIVGLAKGRSSLRLVARVWLFSWIGNLAGSMLLAWMVVSSGALMHARELIESVSAGKMALEPWPLFLRAVLCNWLVCLAVWTSGRAHSETAKCVLIFWCLFAFIACGFEHSVANMTLLSMALFEQHGSGVTWGGFAYNMGIVTLGNILGGAGFVGGAYLLISRKTYSANAVNNSRES
jgi:nitrite transporter NirC